MVVYCITAEESTSHYEPVNGTKAQPTHTEQKKYFPTTDIETERETDREAETQGERKTQGLGELTNVSRKL